jgi:hypothetical protein
MRAEIFLLFLFIIYVIHAIIILKKTFSEGESEKIIYSFNHSSNAVVCSRM